MDKIRIMTEYNALLEVKDGNAVLNKDYKKLFDEIKKPLEKLNKDNDELEIVYFFDTNTNEFSVFSSSLSDEDSRTICSEFLTYLNRKAIELLS
tara:strand:- start:294 stop:575 length:282 start_codon:yes stop_codon:yes gene_type:complete